MVPHSIVLHLLSALSQRRTQNPFETPFLNFAEIFHSLDAIPSLGRSYRNSRVVDFLLSVERGDEQPKMQEDFAEAIRGCLETLTGLGVLQQSADGSASEGIVGWRMNPACAALPDFSYGDGEMPPPPEPPNGGADGPTGGGGDRGGGGGLGEVIAHPILFSLNDAQFDRRVSLALGIEVPDEGDEVLS